MATAIGTGTDQDNFFRMSILIVDYAVKILQDVLQVQLRKKYPNLFDPSTGLLNKVLGDATVRATLFGLSSRVFNPHQRNQLYPAGKPSSSVTVGDLDITLTVLLLRNITTLNPRPRSKAWDNPSDTDISTEATIGRVKRYRNVVYGHANKAAISDREFLEHFRGLKSNLQALSRKFTNEEYDDILSKPFNAALLETNQSILKEWFGYDKDVKDELLSMKATVEEMPKQLSHIEQVQKGSEDTVIREMRSETQSTREQIEKLGFSLEQKTEEIKDQLQAIYGRDRDRPESQKIPEIQEKIEVIYDRDRDRPESQKIQGKHVMVDRSTDKSEDHPAKRSRLHTIKPDPLYQAPVMSPTHNNLLLQKRPILIKDLQVEDIIPDMVARGILSKRNADKIKAQKTEQEQAFEFLCVLPKCGPRAFDTFVEVLREHNKKELADLLAEKATTCSSKNQIANFYMNHMSQIQRLPWDPNDTMHMDDVYVNLQWVQEESKPKGANFKSVKSYTSIFKDTKQGNRPKRILVRGKAGIGKTTFTQKMATDWANNAKGLKKCEEVLSKYEYLIILNLRSIQPGQTLKEAIEIQIPCSAETGRAVAEETMHALDNNSDHVLLVFDGYDEYDPKTSQEITDVINRRRYQDVCTVITTRPWKAEELRKRQIMDSVYEITGLTIDNIIQYITTFFDDKKTYDENKKYIFMSSEEFEKEYALSYVTFPLELFHRVGQGLLPYLEQMGLMSLAQTPILLLFICLMWEDMKSDSSTSSLPGSYTLLYEKLIELLMSRRYNSRTKNEVKEYLGKFEQTFFNLGKLALEGLLKPVGGLLFDEEDLQSIPNMSELYSLGLLSRSKVHCNLYVKHEVTFLHKTIQELFAAKYLAGTIDENDNALDEFLGWLNTLDRLYDMEYVLRFLCGLSEQAIAKVRPRVQELAKMDATLKHIYSSNSSNTEVETISLFNKLACPRRFLFDSDISDWYIRHFNNLLLEHWYAHCTQESDLTPELAPWHTILSIPYSFKHSDPRFQEVLENSLRSNKQIWKNVFQDANTVIFDYASDAEEYQMFGLIYEDEDSTVDAVITLLMMCENFKNLSLVFWADREKGPSTNDVFKRVLSNAPNLNTLCISSIEDDSPYEDVSSIQNPAKLCHLIVRIYDNRSEAPISVDTQILRQMSALKHLHIERDGKSTRNNTLIFDLGGQLQLSHGLTYIVIRNFSLTAERVKILGENLHHVPGLEQLKLDGVFDWIHTDITRKFWFPLWGWTLYNLHEGCPYDDRERGHRCPGVCEAMLELSKGVAHTPKLKHFSFSMNRLGLYCGIASPLTALVQSLCTVSEQNGMKIALYGNDVHKVDGLREQIVSISSSYQHVIVAFNSFVPFLFF